MRDWLVSRAPEKLDEVDNLFSYFSDADMDAFRRMVSIAELLKNQSRVIVNLLLADQEKLARKLIIEAREAFSPIEKQLGDAIRDLQGIRSTLGYPG